MRRFFDSVRQSSSPAPRPGFGNLAVGRFAEAGWNVVATVRKESDRDVHRGLPHVRTLLLDVDDEQADLAFGKLAMTQFGRVDAVINNAGYFQGGPLEASTMDQVHRQFPTNVFGLIALNKAFIPIFRQQRSGVIVNVSSISADGGFRTPPSTRRRRPRSPRSPKGCTPSSPSSA